MGLCLLFYFIFLNTTFLQAGDKLPSEGIAEASVLFFSTALPLQYDRSMHIKQKTCTSDRCLKRFYKKMEETQYELLVQELLVQREALALNDWFFFQLVQKSAETIYADKTDIFQTLATWFLFTKAGYDTRINNANNQYVFINVRTDDELYYTPFSRPEKGIKYVNLTAIHYQLNTRTALYEMSKFRPNPEGQKFTFQLDNWPNIPAQVDKKTLSFPYQGTDYNLTVDVDTTIRALMAKYPIMRDEVYYDMPVSKTLANSLLPQLRDLIEGRPAKDQIEILVSVTRRCFDYAWDYKVYDRAMPLGPDQVFFTPVSDHEDRAALLHYLVKSLTDLDLIVMRYYESYYTVAVALPEAVGKPLSYEGKDYYFCDPTEPMNSCKIGKQPSGFKTEDMQVIVHLQQ